MRAKFVGPHAELLANADSNDFIGSTRVIVQLSPSEYTVIPLPKKFGWNTLSVAPVNGASVNVYATISSMDQIRDGNAIWIPLPEACGDLPNADSFAGASTSQAFMYAWEHPIVAFGFSGATDTEVRVEVCSKHD